MDRDAIAEAHQLLAEGLGHVQTSEGTPALPEDFARGVALLEEARTILRVLAEEPAPE